MGKLQDRKIIVSKIHQAALLYKQYLVGKQFLYVFDNRYIEVIYKAENFKHLTGVDTFLSAKRFYTYSLKGQLTAAQITFTASHPYDLCLKKIKHIEDISTLAGAESFMLEEISTSTKMYKFGTTDLHFSLCMNKELDNNGKEKGTCYVVQSLRDEDCFARSKNVYDVTHILSKQNDAKKYTEIRYADERELLSGLKPEILELIDESII